MLCCHAFDNLILNAGERGFAVLVSENKDGVKFSLQMRAVSFADEGNLPKGPLPTMPTHLTLSGSMRIRYCPSCGKRLDDLVTADTKSFKELAGKHAPFQNNWGV